MIWTFLWKRKKYCYFYGVYKHNNITADEQVVINEIKQLGRYKIVGTYVSLHQTKKTTINRN